MLVKEQLEEEYNSWVEVDGGYYNTKTGEIWSLHENREAPPKVREYLSKQGDNNFIPYLLFYRRNDD